MKPTHVPVLVAIALLAAASAHADASYEETSQVTGGSLLKMTKSMSFFSRSMKSISDPTITQVYVSGDRMARVTADAIDITDLSQKEFIHIDKQKRTYTITTFAQAQQAVQNAAEQMKNAPQQQQATPAQQPQQPSDVKLSYSFNVKETGATQAMEGGTAREVLITSQLNATSATQPGEATMEMTNDVWLLDNEPAAYKEVRDFDRRLGEAMVSGMMANGNPFASNPMIASKPGASDSFAGMAEQMKKLHGFSVMEVTRMGVTQNGEPLPPPQTAAADASSGSGGDAAKKAAAQSAGSAASSRLTKGLGSFGLGGFGHKKQNDSADSQTPPADSQTPPDPVLMEITTKKSNFSSAPVSSSVFDIPAGYQQIGSPR